MALIKKEKKSLSKREKKIAYVALSKKNHLSLVNASAAPEAANFEYTIMISGVSVSLLDINGTVVDPIKASDKIFADRGQPFYAEVRAKLESPTGSGTLQLKDLTKNKDVFDKPQLFQFGSSSSGGLFLDNVKLP